MYHIASYFDVRAERRADFIAAALADGRDSIADERGTIRFELIQDEGNETRFWLNEAYIDRDAFERQHKGGIHYKKFFALIREYACSPDDPVIRGNTITDGAAIREGILEIQPPRSG